MKKYIIVTILVLFAGVSVAPALNLDDQIKTNQDKYQNIGSQLKDTQKKLQETRKQESTLIQQIENSDRNISRVQSQIANIQNDLSVVTGKRKDTEKELHAVEAELEKIVNELEKAMDQVNHDRATLNKRVANTYKYGDVTYLEVLLNSTSFTDLITRASLLRLIIEQDYQILKRMERMQQAIENKKLKIEDVKVQIETIRSNLIAQERRISAIKNSEESKKREEQNAKSQKKQLLKQVEENKEYFVQAQKELEQKSREIESMIQNLIAQKQASSSDDGARPGRLLWPVSGRVSSEFGYRDSPCSGCSENHKGMDIAAPTGTSIKSAASGKVIIASYGYNGGYGNYVVIDHGGGMTTLYAHCSSLTVSTGQTVSAGSIIAKVGSTGNSSGLHLHFEVRINGTAKNPRSYL